MCKKSGITKLLQYEKQITETSTFFIWFRLGRTSMLHFDPNSQSSEINQRLDFLARKISFFLSGKNFARNLLLSILCDTYRYSATWYMV